MGNLFNKDFQEFIEALNQAEAKYILVGGYSVVIHGYPRTTGDLDIWVECSESNYEKLLEAFGLFKLPVFDMTMANFLNSEKLDVFRFGRPPVAIDIITKLKGLDFEEAWQRVQTGDIDDVKVNYLHFNDLIKAKTSSGRPRDLDDIENLQDKERKRPES